MDSLHETSSEEVNLGL